EPGPDPKPGDLIEYQRLGYQHWGIYVGDGFVVHLTDQDGFSSISSAFGASAVVRKDRMERVAAGCYYKVNNKYDGKRTPLPIRKVVHAALDKVGETLNYSLTSENCEHFVTELRYGESFSDQEKKQIGHNVTQNSKNGLDKIVGTLSKLWINKIVSSM
uniref:LRAT domain-containing protein n=1 Tax=Leptobrachium leishanense TaxID=445787 RepID=A0A8C5R973_9ANUR